MSLGQTIAQIEIFRMAPIAALFALAVLPSLTALPITPFTKLADEIYEAEHATTELEWKVSNSSAEKESVKWFMSTALKELTELKKVVMNSSVPGTLGFKYEQCTNKTGAKMPKWNQSLTFEEALKNDTALGPGVIEAKMYDLFKAQEKNKDLTQQLGECTARCPMSALITKAKKQLRQGHLGLAKAPAPAPAPAPGGAAGGGGAEKKEKSHQEVMRGIADAIYNTSESMDQMKLALNKDEAAKQVLQSVTSTVMMKLLNAKKAVAEMEKDLEHCIHEPAATHLGDHVIEAMAGNTDVSMELIDSAEGKAKEAQDETANLEAKLEDCNSKCP
jgi:hypothetical protein